MKKNIYDIIIVLLVIMVVFGLGYLFIQMNHSQFDVSCTAKIDDKSVLITVDANQAIDKYLYNGLYESTNNSYTLDYKNANNYVKVFYDGHEKTITCQNQAKINAQCLATIDDTQTTIDVTTNEQIDDYVYNGEKHLNSNHYVTNKRIIDNYVILYQGQNSDKIMCQNNVIINATCQAQIKDGKTIIKVDSTTPIEQYLYNQEYESRNHEYTINKVVNENSVTVTSLGQQKTIACTNDLGIDVKCSAKVKGDQTYIVVNSTAMIDKYVYNNQYESPNNSYLLSQKVMNNYVNVYIGDASKKVDCQTTVDDSKLEIHLFDSGFYDDAILIRTDDKTIFIDGGRYNCYKKVLPYLEEAGVKKIDLLIGSHVESDHVQTQGPIIDKFTVSEALYSIDIHNCHKDGTCETVDQEYVLDAINRHNIKTTVAVVPSKISVGDMELYIIGPQNITKNKNNNSLIFILKYYHNTFMFTGDSDASFKNYEELRRKAQAIGLDTIDVDVLKYPHHGNVSLKESILKAMNPETIVVPNARAPKFPEEKNKNLIKQMGIKMYRVSEGNILLQSDGSNISVTTGVKASDYKR